MSLFNPGMKVFSQIGKSNEIGSMLGRYDVIIELIHRHRRDLWDRPQPASQRTMASDASSYDLDYQKGNRAWIEVPFVFGFMLFLFVFSLQTSELIHKIFGVFFLLGIFPGFLYEGCPRSGSDRNPRGDVIYPIPFLPAAKAHSGPCPRRFNNGFAEGINLKIKMLNRRGFGYRSFKSFRLHVLVAFVPAFHHKK